MEGNFTRPINIFSASLTDPVIFFFLRIYLMNVLEHIQTCACQDADCNIVDENVKLEMGH